MISFQRTLFCLLCLIASFNPVKAQSFRNFAEVDDEPIGPTFGITQDKSGVMWFGTTGSIIRYDTRTLKPYRSDAQRNPVFLDTRDVLCDSQGRIWAATASGLTLYDLNTGDIRQFRHDSLRANSLSSNYVNCIIEDSKGQLWLGTQHGVTRVTTGQGTIKISRHLQNEFSRETLNVKCLAEGKDGSLWIGTSDGLVQMPGNGGKARHYRLPVQAGETSANEFIAAYAGDDGAIWLGNSAGGLFRFDPGKQAFRLIEKFKSETGESPKVRDIISDGRGRLLLATSTGLAHFDPRTEDADWYVNNPGDPYSLPENSLYSLYRDNQGGLWLGSYFTGISYVHFDSPRFRRWPFLRGDAREKSFRNVWIGKGKRNVIWSISDNQDKLLVFDENGKNPSSIPLKLSAEADYYAFYLDQNDVLWAGGNTVLTSYDIRRGTYRHYPFKSPRQGNPLKGRTYAITEDSYGRFWVGGAYGLLLFDKQRGEYVVEPTVTHAATIFEDSRRSIWIGGKEGLYRIKPGGSPIPAVEKIPTQSDLVIAWRVHEDKWGTIWAACHMSLLFYNPKTNRFELNTDIPQEAALDVVPDNQGYLWVNASSKLYRYHPRKRTLQSYGYQDGLPPKGTLMQSAGTSDRNGRLYFVSNEGAFTFDPAAISIEKHPASIVVSSLKLYNKTVRKGDSTGLLPVPLAKIKEITFRHDQSIFTLDFALLDYVRSNDNHYAYKIDGIDRDWNYVRTPSATYTNLPAGNYVFQAKAANGDGVWTNEPLQLKITVLPPWWRTWYAYLVYLLLMAGAVYAITRFFWLRSSFRRESALNQVKLDFFTNVSHEIRTHLSLISGPLEKAFQQATEGKNNENYLSYARSNSDRLMLLVNELLDFRKIQSGGTRLQVREHDVTRVVRNVLAAFEHVAKEKDVETILLCPDTPVLLWFDLAQMQKVFYNLLSNAYKFTTDGGKVVARIAEISNEVSITVEDNGKGISEAHLRKLFTYYYQADSEKPGYGIGLALSKSIVEQHCGYLTAESRLATDTAPGSTALTIRMLRENRHFSPDQIATLNGHHVSEVLVESITVPQSNGIAHSKKNNTILLIEDNDQLRVFIRELFEDEFTVLEAENGLKGLELANEQLPDMILSDVMMPGLNGLEVCERLKSNAATSHIPVVLLTARTQNEQVIEGLSSGADDYLIKPFDPRILVLKINNLIRLRDEMKERYRQSLLTEPDSGGSIARDMNEAFIAKLRSSVIENLSDPNFGVSELAFQVGMSTSVLYRKMRSLTDMTVNEFVKTIRLNEAKKLLESGVYHVGEVATIIGFDDPKYFSKEFRKVFGKTPIEIKKQVPN
jgi:signal transduction histidine kinase/ligand-binding sensor domain-containing protein/CheY-like chemotaxis protein/methylphosphotriester-DNA--protein-cysteine methyltransferase